MYFLQTGIPFVRFLILLMAGIASAILLDLYIAPGYIGMAIAVYLIAYFYERKYPVLNTFKSLTAWCILYLTGVLLTNSKTEKNSLSHFTHINDTIICYTAILKQEPEHREKTNKIILSIETCKTNQKGWIKASGKIIGYIQQGDSLNLNKGNIVLIQGSPFPIPGPSNPGQFNYALFLQRQGIYSNHFIRKGMIKKIGSKREFWLFKLADGCRNFCEKEIRKGIKGENEYQLTAALLLGVKAGLDEKLYQAYSETGTVHALAVSGLHVSLIYFIVVIVFGFLKKVRQGKFVFTFVSITIFWFYALVTGLSPSVVRAVTMFSVVLLATIFRRNTGIYNILAFSAFVILCIEPYWLMDIGFQFSFLAVVGIAYFYPVLYNWWPIKNKIGEKLWSLVCLSVAAQLAVSPLSIYYFNSFPLLFLPFNLVIVPISSLALYTGLIGLITCKIPFLSTLFMWITEYCVRFMNYLVQLPSGTSFLKWDFLSFNLFELVSLYCLIICFFIAIKIKSYNYLKYSMIVLLLFIGSFISTTFYKYEKKTVTVYNIKGKTVLSLLHRGKAVVISDNLMSYEQKEFKYNLYGHLAEQKIKKLHFELFAQNKHVSSFQYAYGTLIVWEGIKIFRIKKDTPNNMKKYLYANMDYIIVSDVQLYKQLQKTKSIITSAKVIMDSSLRVAHYDLCDNYYSVARDGAFVATE